MEARREAQNRCRLRAVGGADGDETPSIGIIWIRKGSGTKLSGCSCIRFHTTLDGVAQRSLPSIVL